MADVPSVFAKLHKSKPFKHPLANSAVASNSSSDACPLMAEVHIVFASPWAWGFLKRALPSFAAT
eukprot:6182872-Karenia_brevis.AAC.1